MISEGDHPSLIIMMSLPEALRVVAACQEFPERRCTYISLSFSEVQVSESTGVDEW